MIVDWETQVEAVANERSAAAPERRVSEESRGLRTACRLRSENRCPSRDWRNLSLRKSCNRRLVVREDRVVGLWSKAARK